MGGELDDQAQSHQHAGEVGREPTGVVDDLQDGAVVVRVEARLVVGFARIAQRVVHVDQHLALLAGLGALQQDPAGEVLGNVRPRIHIMLELEKLDAVGLVMPARPQRELIGPLVQGEVLRLLDELGNQPGAERALRRHDLHHGAGHVALVHLGHAGQLLDGRAGADALRRGRGLARRRRRDRSPGNWRRSSSRGP